jgi:hypothetical protein
MAKPEGAKRPRHRTCPLPCWPCTLPHQHIVMTSSLPPALRRCHTDPDTACSQQQQSCMCILHQPAASQPEDLAVDYSLESNPGNSHPEALQRHLLVDQVCAPGVTCLRTVLNSAAYARIRNRASVGA